MFLKVVFSLLLGWTLWSCLTLLRNYRQVSHIGFRVLISPVDATNPLWVLSSGLLYPILRRLPFGLSDTVDRLQLEFSYFDRYEQHSRYGVAFLEVTPKRKKLWLADAQGLDDVMRRRNDFIKPPDDYFVLETFGPNLDTVNGKTWDRHKRITTAPFNENNSALVWRATINQATDMFNLWTHSDTVSHTQEDVRKMALNVLCEAGFGVDAKFMDHRDGGKGTEDSLNQKNGKQNYGYRECLRILLDNFFYLIFQKVLEHIGYPTNLMWGQLKKLTLLKAELRTYFDEMIANERVYHEQGNRDRHNLLSSLVSADIDAKQNVLEDRDKRLLSDRGLSTDELHGNLFIYNFAGHDTTAMTLHFAILRLAMDSSLQDWIAEEVRDVVRDMSSNGEQFYEIAFPRAKRCLALMYEALRLYGPVICLSRKTVSESGTALLVRDRTYIIPSDTYVLTNVGACHTDPGQWGPDPLAFRPSRFINPATASESESFRTPPVPGSYLAWALGPRTCPGRKFSQVEFVAAILVFYSRNHRVKFVRKSGDSEATVIARAIKLIDGAKLRPTLQMKGDMDLKWVSET